ncbi:MAG TPA: hypothetical protein VHK69_17060 [Chitinophagaceae bacterium]|jgi:hypothetical protein|nr:hypothetical protein [Chitinophagaceae bacterium]
MILRGIVVEKPFGRGSKSDSVRIYLETGEGAVLLRLPGPLSFGVTRSPASGKGATSARSSDPPSSGSSAPAASFIGRRVEVEGELQQYLFLVTRITPLEDEEKGNDPGTA